MRKGIYAIYKGKEFRAFSMGDNSYKLVSYNFEDAFKGFEKVTDCAYSKYVKQTDLDELYRIKTVAEHRGKRYLVVMEKVNEILVVGEDGGKPDIRPGGVSKISFLDSVWLPKNKVSQLMVEKEPIPTKIPLAQPAAAQLKKTS